jgi:hypothetical protein
MVHLVTTALFFAIVLASSADPPEAKESRSLPESASNAHLNSPVHDRERVYLTTFNFYGISSGVEVHVRGTRLAGGQVFFSLGNSSETKMVPITGRRYNFHTDHDAVDITFAKSILPDRRS